MLLYERNDSCVCARLSNGRNIPFHMSFDMWKTWNWKIFTYEIFIPHMRWEHFNIWNTSLLCEMNQFKISHVKCWYLKHVFHMWNGRFTHENKISHTKFSFHVWNWNNSHMRYFHMWNCIRSNTERPTMRTRPGFQVGGIRFSPRRSQGLERNPSTWKPGLVRIGGLWRTSQNQLVY